MNMPMLLDVLDEVKVENPFVCFNINEIGFRMCGGQKAYEQALSERKFRAIAMSVFASGAIEPSRAIEWVCRQPNIEAIVFGASSRRNIRNTKELVDRYWPHQHQEMTQTHEAHAAANAPVLQTAGSNAL